MVRRFLVRALALVGLAYTSVVMHASPAEAHSADQTPSSNFVTRMSPLTTQQRAAFRFGVIEATSRVELKWKAGPKLTVLGYDGEAYLRIGPEGVEENQNSNATYVNKSRLGDGDIPANLDADLPPNWKRVSNATVARWHDHRVHWMSTADPVGVIEDPNREQLVQPWELPILIGDVETMVRGELRWKPGPSPVVPLVVSAVIGIGVLGAVLKLGQSGRAVVPGAFAALALVIVDAIHLRGIAFGIKGTLSAGLGRMVSIGFVPIAAWIVMLAAIVLLRRKNNDAWYLMTLAAALITVIGGIADFGILSRTSVPFAGGAALARWSVAITIGLGIALVIAGVLQTRVRVAVDDQTHESELNRMSSAGDR